jgi:glycosyltransferase involved in cell wall biosynthesis
MLEARRKRSAMRAASVSAAESEGPPGSARKLRVATVGMSTSRICGVRDHAVLLAEALAREDVSSTVHWLWREDRSFAAGRREVRDWTRELSRELERARAETVLMHYSVFAYSYRGIPLYVRPTIAAVRGLGLPLVTVLHEYAYPWGRGGARGRIWAASQRAVLPAVMRSSAAVAVTADFRIDWLQARRWLPRRPVALAPVFPTLPPPTLDAGPSPGESSLGLFGYGYEGAAVSLVLDALRLLRDRGRRVQLRLLGAPGRSSAAAEEWLAGARARGVERALSFSGVLSAQELSDALAACTVLLSAEPTGPTSRKTTLAASLASGRPVVALDGPLRWSEILDSHAARVVQPTATALSDAVAGLLDDDAEQLALGARGRGFAERRIGVERSAEAVARLLHAAVDRQAT